MKPFELFRSGTHTSAGGSTLQFGEADLQAAVAAYDPAVHEAPIVVGHPKDNAPAYGWVKSLSFSDGVITAEPIQVDQQFAEMVQAGRFKKRSASFYTPDSPHNPKPGAYYLRHVGFLGAQPPAVKGLRDVSFSEDDGVVEFSDYEAWGFSSIASLFRGLRDWLLAEKGMELADKVIPSYSISSIEDAAKQAADSAKSDTQAGGAMPAFTEEDTMEIERLQARVRELEAQNAALKANQRPADFAEREADLERRAQAIGAREAELGRAAIERRVDAAIAAGRLLKAQRTHAVAFAASLADGEAVIEFGEGDKAEKVSQREAYLRQIEQAPKLVEFGELSGRTGADGGDGRPSIEEAQQALRNQVANPAAAKK